MLPHVPVWFTKFHNNGKNIALAIDGHSGKLSNSVDPD